MGKTVNIIIAMWMKNMCLSLLKQKLSFGKYIEIANLTILHAWLCPFIYLNISINKIRQIKLTWTMAVWSPKVPLYIHCHPPKMYCTWFILEDLLENYLLTKTIR